MGDFKNKESFLPTKFLDSSDDLPDPLSTFISPESS